MADERRQFERVNIPDVAKIYAVDANGKRLGPVRVLGHGGLLIDTKEKYSNGLRLPVTIVDESEGIRRKVEATVRYTQADGVGFQFEGLPTEAAVEIGVIIGKHSPRGAGRA